MSNYLGIDLGTQSLKAIIYDAEGHRTLGSGSAELHMISEADGTREQLAEWWLEALAKALSQITPQLKTSVKAIGVSGQQHGFVPVSAGGEVLAPVKLWCDTATAVECDEVMSAFGGEQRCTEEAGNPILPGYTASKIRWLMKHHPNPYREMATVMLPHDYLNFHLTGERFTECGDASGTGVFDVRQRCWHSEMLAAVDSNRNLAECMPRLIGPGETGGTLLRGVAESLELPPGIPVACGGGDNMMAAIATGNVVPGRLTISLGTSGTMFAYSDAPCIDQGGDLAAFCSSTGGWLPLLCTMNCTVATEQVRSLLRMDLEALEQAIAGSAPGAGGVTVLPFYNGERTPNLPNGAGCVLGLDMDNTTPANIARASMEAAIFGLRLGLDAFRRNDCEITDIRLTGGAAQSPTWRQAIADNFELPVRLLAADEGAALGAALNAMLLCDEAHGDSAALSQAIDPHIAFDETATAMPSPSEVAAYHDYYHTYRQYLQHLTPVFK